MSRAHDDIIVFSRHALLIMYNIIRHFGTDSIGQTNSRPADFKRPHVYCLQTDHQSFCDVYAHTNKYNVVFFSRFIIADINTLRF